MGDEKVGGSPATIHDGGAGLAAAAKDMPTRASGFAQAGSKGVGGAGSAALAAAISRFATAYGQVCDDLGTQLGAAGMLATNASADLRTAGGH